MVIKVLTILIVVILLQSFCNICIYQFYTLNKVICQLHLSKAKKSHQEIKRGEQYSSSCNNNLFYLYNSL